LAYDAEAFPAGGTLAGHLGEIQIQAVTPASCSHATRGRPGADVIRTLLGRAIDRCAAEGQRWTPARQRVYELVLQAGAPVKAYDIMDLYRDGPAAKPPTVYRALEFLEQVRLVHRIPSLNAYVACHGEDQAHAAAFLICDCCGSADEFEPGPVEAASRAAAAHTFETRTIVLEVRGRCRRCAD
jgi:Fur family zinc uptake transcriptional regulator